MLYYPFNAMASVSFTICWSDARLKVRLMTSTKSGEQPSHRQNLSTKSDKQNYSRRVQVNTSFGRINITEGIMLALFIRIKKYIVYIYIYLTTQIVSLKCFLFQLEGLIFHTEMKSKISNMFPSF